MTTVNELVTEIRQATDYQLNKTILREKIQTDLHVTHQGGLFKATPELIAFLSVWDQDVIYLEDEYQNPIAVDRTALLTTCKQHFQRNMNTWHQQHAELRKIRKV
jgi:hypothetical protein